MFIIAFIAAPAVDIDGIREPVSGSLLYGNLRNLVSPFFNVQIPFESGILDFALIIENLEDD
jgi:hypothetical protein